MPRLSTSSRLLCLCLVLQSVAIMAFVPSAFSTRRHVPHDVGTLSSTLAPHPPSQTPSNSDNSSRIKVLTNLSDLITTVKEESKPNQLCVINFHASYCKVCQRVQIKYKQIAKRHSKDEQIQFASLECSRISSKQLRTLGVKKFPFVQIWRNAKCVASFGPGASYLYQKRVGDTVQMCLDRSDQEWHEFETEFANHIQNSQLALDKIQEELEKEETTNQQGKLTP